MNDESNEGVNETNGFNNGQQSRVETVCRSTNDFESVSIRFYGALSVLLLTVLSTSAVHSTAMQRPRFQDVSKSSTQACGNVIPLMIGFSDINHD